MGDVLTRRLEAALLRAQAGWEAARDMEAADRERRNGAIMDCERAGISCREISRMMRAQSSAGLSVKTVAAIVADGYAAQQASR
jgi:hypothetical protein